MKNLSILAIFLVLTICDAARFNRQASITFRETRQTATKCTDPSGAPGACTSLYNCEPYLARLRAKPGDSVAINFIRRSNEVCRRPQPIVCCPNTSKGHKSYKLPTPAEGCGVSHTTARKIVGGDPAVQGTWPWIALLGYANSLDPARPFRCGGTLITSRHVLTAAHCASPLLEFVRLGEHNLSTDKEANHVDINIARTVPHPDFTKKTGRNDIAVIYLEQDVQFTNAITPICLPSDAKHRFKNYVGYNPFVAGWGQTSVDSKKISDILYELQIPILENEECQTRYHEKGYLARTDRFDEPYLCAGVLAGGKDSCYGDSGGPLTIAESIKNKFHFYLIGVTSFGIKCAEAEAPGLYAKVQYFIDWIEQRIAEPI